MSLMGVLVIVMAVWSVLVPFRLFLGWLFVLRVVVMIMVAVGAMFVLT